MVMLNMFLIFLLNLLPFNFKIRFGLKTYRIVLYTMFNCTKCNVGFTSQSLLNKHLKKKTTCDGSKPKFICQHCHQPYSSQGYLNRHNNTKHKNLVDNKTELIAMCNFLSNVDDVQNKLSERNYKLINVKISDDIVCDVEVKHFYKFESHNIGPCNEEEYLNKFMTIFGDDDFKENDVKKLIEKCRYIPSNNYILTGRCSQELNYNKHTNKCVINNYLNAYNIIDHNRPEKSSYIDDPDAPVINYAEFIPEKTDALLQHQPSEIST